MSFLSTVQEILEQGPFCAVAAQESSRRRATFTFGSARRNGRGDHDDDHQGKEPPE